jgi:hypothetical protein
MMSGSTKTISGIFIKYNGFFYNLLSGGINLLILLNYGIR